MERTRAISKESMGQFFWLKAFYEMYNILKDTFLYQLTAYLS